MTDLIPQKRIENKILLNKKQQIIRRAIIKLAIYLITFYLLGSIGSYLIADRIIFHPRPISYRDSDSIIKIKVTKAEKIAAIYLKNPTAKFTILYSHGNAEDLGRIAETLQQLTKHGFSVMAYDYRGYGLSNGQPSEANVYQDANATFNYLTDKLKIPKNRIILFGRSLGSGPAVDLASREAVAGLILESPFTSTVRVATKIKILPFDRFDNIAKIGQVKCPILIFHGTKDAIIPFSHGKQLYAEANNPKIFSPVKGAGHNNVASTAGTAYWQQIDLFIKQLN